MEAEQHLLPEHHGPLEVEINHYIETKHYTKR